MATLYRCPARLRQNTDLPDVDARRPGDGAPSTGRAARRTAARRRRGAAAPPRHLAYTLALGVLSVLAVGNAAVGGPLSVATASPQLSESASVADALGIDGSGVVVSPTEERELLGRLAASRATRDAEQATAVASQVQAEQAAAAAIAEAEARAAADAAAAAAAEAAAAAAAEAAVGGPAPASSTAATAVARIRNSGGPVRSQVQVAADAVVSHVPGASGITLGGTRASAADPGGHPSGLALDYMVMSDAALGDAIVAYHVAHWDALDVDYIIWQQRMLSSPGGGWKAMANRGSATANHMDHPHVNYRG